MEKKYKIKSHGGKREGAGRKKSPAVKEWTKITIEKKVLIELKKHKKEKQSISNLILELLKSQS